MLLGISRSTYYNWLKRREGERRPRKPANRLTDMEVDRVVEHNFPFADASDGDGISTAQTQIRAVRDRRQVFGGVANLSGSLRDRITLAGRVL